MRACQISREPLSDRDMKILRMILGQKESVSGAWKIENIERRWLIEHHLGGGARNKGTCTERLASKRNKHSEP